MVIEAQGPAGPGGRTLSLVHIGPAAVFSDLIDSARGLVVADRSVLAIHGSVLPAGMPVVAVPAGEEAKSAASLEALWRAFGERRLDRGASVLAFGGGAACDLAGFAAATWLRGIEADYMPTTLLAMVDASVGGKTGIDFGGRKNMVGAFASPRRVLMDVAFLDSLPDAEFSSGMAEVVKHAFIAGGDRFAFLETIARARPRISEPGGREVLERIVADSVQVKAGVVSRDPREEGERRVLNLGHTYGHALESVLGLPHGHAVAAGLGTACRLADFRRESDPGVTERLVGLLARFGLPTSLAEAFAAAGKPGTSRPAIAEALLADKKRLGSSVHFAMPRRPGAVGMVEIPVAELAAFAEEAP